MEQAIARLVEQTGPLTGAALQEQLGGDAFDLWKTCRLSPQLATERVGRRYLRIDGHVDGWARLSPSVVREFLTYTVIGRAGDPSIARRAEELQRHIRTVSRRKRDLAARVMADVAEGLPAEAQEDFCALLAGDIVFDMAHDVDRPERSTGTLVNGSDLDIVVVVADEAPAGLAERLAAAIHRQKFLYLRNPAFREEIDYVVKRFATLREQAAFDTVRRMVACKVYGEAVLLAGSRGLHAAGRAVLEERGVIDRLRRMEEVAFRAREQHEAYLLTADEAAPGRESSLGLYTDDEAEELA